MKMKKSKMILMALMVFVLMAAGVQQVLAEPNPPALEGSMPQQAATAVPTLNQEVIWVVTTTPRADGTVYHVVQQGQAAWSIASAYGITVSQLASLNNLDAANPAIFPGDELLVKQAETPVATATSEATPEPLATMTPDLPPTATADIAQLAAQVTVPAATEKSEGDKIRSDPQRLVGYGLVLLSVIGLGALFVSAFRRA